MLSSTKKVENRLYIVIEFKSTYCVNPGLYCRATIFGIESENTQQTPLVVLSARLVHLFVQVEIANETRAEPLRVQCHVRVTDAHVREVVRLEGAVLVLSVHVFHTAVIFPFLVTKVVQIDVEVLAVTTYVFVLFMSVFKNPLRFVVHRHQNYGLSCFIFVISEALQIRDGLVHIR